MADKSEMRSQVDGQAARMPENRTDRSPEDIQKALLELRVRQAELEMQNAELRQAKADMEASRARYFDLFDQAPAGYVTVSEEGLILEANLSASTLLGVARGELAGQPLSRFILNEDQDNYSRHCKQLFETAVPQSCEMRVVKTDKTTFWAHLAATIDGGPSASSGPAPEGGRVWLIEMSDITERKQAEEVLRLSQSYLAAIADNQPGPIWLKDRDSRFLSVNMEFAKSCGLKDPSLLAGKSDLDVWPRERALRSIAEDAQVMITGKSCTTEDPVADQGEVRWVETFKTPVLDEYGQVIGTTGYSRDITARKQTEERLRAHQRELEMQNEKLRLAQAELAAERARYFDLYDLTPVGYCTISEEGLVLEANLTAATLLGVARRALAQHPLTHFILPEDQGIYSCHLQQLFETGAPQAFELRMLKPDGTAFWTQLVSIIAQDLTAAAGATVCRIVVSDITERKQAEVYRKMGEDVLQLLNGSEVLSDSIERVVAAIQTRLRVDAVGIRLQNGDDFPYAAQHGFSEDFLRTENTLIERGADGGVCRDEKGRICLECTCGLVLSGKTDPSNPHFSKGGSFWAADAFPLLDLPAGQDPRNRPRNQCMYKGYASLALVPIRAKDQIVGLLQLNDHVKGRFTLAAIEQLEGIAAHIGEGILRKRSEERVRSLLEESTQARIALLGIIEDEERAQAEKAKLEANLHQAQKMDAVGRLASGVAHDFNNMLGVILGHVELAMNQTTPNQPICSDLQGIHKAAMRSADLTRQLLAFARKQAIAPRILDLNSCVAEMLALMRRLLGEDIHLVWQPGAEVWPVRIDPSQVDQILANLCVNARDAIGGVGQIALATENKRIGSDFCAENPDAVPGDYVMLTVTDDGCGMDKETQAQIFEPFFTTKGMGSGTGLGLATVYGIVKQNNGFITTESEPGRDTTFKVYLPRMATEAVAAAQRPAAEAPRGNQETILLVEDEKAICRIYGQFLTEQGYTVITAETPGEALQWVQEFAGDLHLLLTDVVMPGMDGKQLSRRICALHPGVRVLFMSGYTADMIAQRGVLESDAAFLQKPFACIELAIKVHEVLKAPAPP